MMEIIWWAWFLYLTAEDCGPRLHDHDSPLGLSRCLKLDESPGVSTTAYGVSLVGKDHICDEVKVVQYTTHVDGFSSLV